MCACEPGYLCPRCQGTPADPAYLLEEPEPLKPDVVPVPLEGGRWDG